MTRRQTTIPPEYFDDQYRRNIDPWQFRSSTYEKGKYAATLGALENRPYQSVLEIGCSIGVLTAQLSELCTRLLAVDASKTAVAEAREHCAHLAEVDIRVAVLPEDFPPGRYDLIVLSEVLYYFSPADLTAVAAQCMSSLLPAGEIILCHWLGETDYPLRGEQASELFANAVATKFQRREILHDETYRLERYL